ncbi:cytochrome ubiquinol oxidase subunit I [Alkalimarinus coralli]|uniref:cytochrome ubiquinol oxidase subunit I n=1 Tax=Alkalimarinus coralli TaxID=2935863 RepID=UPI00202B8EBC|nr:cytochrome ubiquinol oxidase subunit I [Alkalimarinus coralli]
MDPAILSRMQFAFTISYHIIFPTITIGLSVYLAVMEGMWLKTKKIEYLQQVKFWLKPFAITFGMGVVSGVVLSYQFGTNFSRFSEVVGPILSPLLAYEVLTAFFLEAGFLGIMLFGWNRVSPKIHFMATVVVCVGTLMSAFWILAANSWMHTPTGYIFNEGRFEAGNWFEVIFNPSFPYRYFHMVIASLLSASLIVAGINAWYLKRNQHRTFAKVGFSFAMWSLLLLAPVQILLGDFHGLNVAEHQPVKLAAMEGIWENEQGAPLRLFAVPDGESEKNDFEIAIPKLASLIITHSLDGEITGLKSVDKADRPPVATVFYSFRVMLALGGLMLLLALSGAILRAKKRLYSSRLLHAFAFYMTPAGIIATLAGWFVVEVGRQPWLVQGLVRTEDVVSILPAENIMLTLGLFVVVYGLLFSVYLYFIRKLIHQGPPSMEEYSSDNAAADNSVNSPLFNPVDGLDSTTGSK